MNSTKFKLEDVFSYNTKKDKISRDQKKGFNIFLAKMM